VKNEIRNRFCVSRVQVPVGEKMSPHPSGLKPTGNLKPEPKLSSLLNANLGLQLQHQHQRVWAPPVQTDVECPHLLPARSCVMGGRHGVPPPAARIEISREEIREREEDAVELIRKRIKERGELKRIRTSKFEATAPYCGKRSMGNRFFGCHTGFWFFLAVAHQSSMVFLCRW
jgi:hypothetical protein